MNEQTALQTLQNVGAILRDDHFVYTSGKHGSAYVNKDVVYCHPWLVSDLCLWIAAQFIPTDVDVVIAPAVGGVLLSQWTAFHIGKNVLATYAEKDGDNFVIKRGYETVIPDKRVLVVEDILTTGGTVRKVVHAVRALGGGVVGVGALCNRGGITTKDVGDVPRLLTLTNVPLKAYPEAACPLCAKGIPVNTEVGKGAEFLARKRGLFETGRNQ